jgi:hypothetical protein
MRSFAVTQNGVKRHTRIIDSSWSRWLASFEVSDYDSNIRINSFDALTHSPQTKNIVFPCSRPVAGPVASLRISKIEVVAISGLG